MLRTLGMPSKGWGTIPPCECFHFYLAPREAALTIFLESLGACEWGLASRDWE